MFAIASNGVVIRSKVSDIRATSRSTMGVSLMNLAEGDSIVSIARAVERDEDEEEVDAVEGEGVAEAIEALAPTEPAADEVSE